MSAPYFALQFLLQLGIILLACRLVGSLMVRIGQPRVIGEMIAGILLGPSLLGLFAPAVQSALFPPASLGLLSTVSKLGLVLYMFVVGSHLQTGIIRQAFRSAAFISVAGIIAPFVLGAALASFLHVDGRFFGAGVSRVQSMLYLGAAMAVTAFPVLARIIHERGIGGTALGTLALAAGATDDAIAWCLLAIVLVGVNPDFNVLGFLGSHAVFVAFLVGAALPRTAATREFSRRAASIAGTVLVPLFFAYSGLSTHLSLLWSSELLVVSIAVILVASIGKSVACWAAARLTGRENREAMAIGALMNARGLMELIMLNIGLEHGLITPTLFTVMVVMTLATTLAAGPTFEWAWRGSKEGVELAGVRAH
ncbi:MAG: cation:proton antiporter [Acidobacteria bacterium]|nr:MAG: cation:proton antiporter [Acidobacteriota bacterium]